MTFKPLNENDTVNTRTLLHEAIPLTGSIISGSYVDTAVPPNPTNLKSYSHGMFQTVYDYNYLSSSANHVFDVTCGISSQAAKVFGASGMQSKKNNIYGQMAQILMGYDLTGSVQLFDEDGDLLANGAKMKEVFVLPFSRLLVKDEIKKETFSMNVDVTNYVAAAQPMDPSTDLITISDLGASNEYRVNSPAGEYGILYAADNNNLLDLTVTNADHKVTINAVEYLRCGLIFYQAGIVVLTGSVFGTHLTNPLETAITDAFNANGALQTALTDEPIDDINTSLLHRIENVQFNNTTELNSTVYFCRANHNEFNYSSNPTYLDNSRVRVKTQSTDEPVAYITTVGLYNDRNELLATAKLSEALKKSPSTEFTIRARLDY